jgi:hypothetical protein
LHFIQMLQLQKELVSSVYRDLMLRMEVNCDQRSYVQHRFHRFGHLVRARRMEEEVKSLDCRLKEATIN